MTRKTMCSTEPSAEVALQKVAQALRDRQHPVTHRQWREDLIDQMRGHLSHAPGVAGRTLRAALKGERNQKSVSALTTPGTGKAVAHGCCIRGSGETPFHVTAARR
jgi:formate-dependent nitrite reductase cytochrome c552 subunit